MTTVYIDEVFFLNALVDYLLLLCAAKLAGEELRRWAFALAALLGGLYAALMFLPGWGFLSHPLCKLCAGVLMALVAYGRSRRLLRVGLTFLGTAAAFGGGVLALQLLSGAPVVPDLKGVCLSAAGCYAFLTLLFRRGTRHGGGELAQVKLTRRGRSCQLTALVDTGNTLTDPLTGKSVMVAQAEAVRSLFPAGECPTPEELQDPLSAMEKRGAGWRLVPYRAVGVDRGLLLACRVDSAQVSGEDRGPLLVALSPTTVSDGGGYTALLGA